eukprot:1762003-Rhodomonas_salina.3
MQASRAVDAGGACACCGHGLGVSVSISSQYVSAGHGMHVDEELRKWPMGQAQVLGPKGAVLDMKTGMRTARPGFPSASPAPPAPVAADPMN